MKAPEIFLHQKIAEEILHLNVAFIQKVVVTD